MINGNRDFEKSILLSLIRQNSGKCDTVSKNNIISQMSVILDLEISGPKIDEVAPKSSQIRAKSDPNLWCP